MRRIALAFFASSTLIAPAVARTAHPLSKVRFCNVPVDGMLGDVGVPAVSVQMDHNALLEVCLEHRWYMAEAQAVAS